MIVDIEAEGCALPKSSDLLVAQALAREDFPDGGDETDGEPGKSGTVGSAQQLSMADLVAVLTGVIAPVVLFLVCALACSERITMLILKHPVESLIEIALALLVPLANYKVLCAVTQKQLRHPIRNGLMIGTAMGVSALAAIVCFVANGLGYPTADKAGNSFSVLVTTISAVCVVSCVTSAYLAVRLRSLREFSSAKLRTGIYCTAGVLLALLLVAGSEAKSVCIRVAEYMSTSENKSEREKALQFLRTLNPELELRMECADERAGGLPGMFIQLDPIAQRQIYFAVTGMPFRDSKAANYSAMSDDYLRRHVVGAAISGLSLLRSAITGSINADSLAATVNWTYVLKNRTYYDQEARAQFSLPPGAVINGVTLWVNGEPRHAQTVPNAAVTNPALANPPQGLLYTPPGVTLGHDVNTLVSDLGRGRYLLHCYPVPAQGELKVSMTIVSPLQPTSATQATVTLPRFVDSNFSLAGDHSLRLRSKQKMGVRLSGFKQGSLSPGEQLLTGTLKEEDLTGPGITIRLDDMPKYEAVAAFDPKSSAFITESVSQVGAAVPKNLIVVLDGTESMRGKLNEIKKGLSKLPQSIHASLLLANEDSSLEPQPLGQALSQLNQSSFVGGQDNLLAVVKASELAGESEGGAVLWIHGAQPSFNQELYITSPYTVAPAFYELPADNGVTDANEFFKNHREIGPFKAIGRSGAIDEDLDRFLSKWQPGGSEYVLSFKVSAAKPDGKVVVGEKAKEVTSLYFDQQCMSLLAAGSSRQAASLGAKYGLVTPASSSLVWLQKNNLQSNLASTSPMRRAQPASSSDLGDTWVSDNSARDVERSASQSQAALVGVTNGTIGPVGLDNTYVMGINTAGTVRVNNLANLEALLNILANGAELVGVLFGLLLIGLSFIKQVSLFNVSLSRTHAIVYGVIFVLVGLAIPGTINWFVASCRDANLFN
jgi:hypothetical protein